MISFQLSNVNSFWPWVLGSFVPKLYPLSWYNGWNVEEDDIIEDKNSFLIGMGRLRQLRLPGQWFFSFGSLYFWCSSNFFYVTFFLLFCNTNNQRSYSEAKFKRDEGCIRVERPGLDENSHKDDIPGKFKDARVAWQTCGTLITSHRDLDMFKIDRNTRESMIFWILISSHLLPLTIVLPWPRLNNHK